jgi:hypothetical protein
VKFRDSNSLNPPSRKKDLVKGSWEVIKECKHRWTPIAPEIGGDGDRTLTWYWCIRCGRLKLDKMIFSPGPHQKMSIKEDKP